MKTNKAFSALSWAIISIFLSLLFSGCASTSHNASQQEQQPDAPPPVAKSGPSFEETRDWIVTTLMQYGGYNSRGVLWHIYSNIAISNSGRLTYTDTEYQSDYEAGSKPFFARLITIPLGAISNIQVEQGVLTGDQDSGVNITTGDNAAITCQRAGNWEDNDNVSTQPSNTEFIWMESVPKSVAGQPMPATPQEMVKHFAAALQHMVDICKDTYTAPTLTPEPF